jgi:hypothetical protein
MVGQGTVPASLGQERFNRIERLRVETRGLEDIAGSSLAVCGNRF